MSLGRPMARDALAARSRREGPRARCWRRWHGAQPARQGLQDPAARRPHMPPPCVLWGPQREERPGRRTWGPRPSLPGPSRSWGRPCRGGVSGAGNRAEQDRVQCGTVTTMVMTTSWGRAEGTAVPSSGSALTPLDGALRNSEDGHVTSCVCSHNKQISKTIH